MVGSYWLTGLKNLFEDVRAEMELETRMPRQTGPAAHMEDSATTEVSAASHLHSQHFPAVFSPGRVKVLCLRMAVCSYSPRTHRPATTKVRVAEVAFLSSLQGGQWFAAAEVPASKHLPRQN